MAIAQAWRQRERSRPVFLRILVLLVAHCGIRAGRVLMWPAVCYYFLTAPQARRASREFLTHVYGRPARSPEVLRHLHVFGATLLDRVLLFSGRHSQLDVRVHNSAALRRAAAQGGCLLMTSHLGSFEVMRVLGKQKAHLPIRMVMDRRPGAMLETVLKRLDPNIAAAIIDRSHGDTECVLRIREALVAGEIVGIMADRIESKERSVYCDFMGRPAAFPLGPWLLAGILGVPVVLCFGLYRGQNRYDLHFETLADRVHLRRSCRNQDAARWAQKYAARLAEYARAAPDNWFNFYSFWADDQKGGSVPE